MARCTFCFDCEEQRPGPHLNIERNCYLPAGHNGDHKLGKEPDATTTDRAVAWLYGIADMLKEKGRKYGNSLDNPVRIFSKAGKADGLAVRIDDKLARIRASEPDDTEDAEADLVGYIALRRGLRDDS